MSKNNNIKKTKKKKTKNLGNKIFVYVMLILAVVSALTSIVAYVLA